MQAHQYSKKCAFILKDNKKKTNNTASEYPVGSINRHSAYGLRKNRLSPIRSVIVGYGRGGGIFYSIF